VGSYVALLRGVNVGGQRRLAMDELRDLFVSEGAQAVETYLQSGNVIFRSGAAPTRLVANLERKIGSKLGAGVSIIVRTPTELAKVLAQNPFARGGADTGRLHVTFLSKTPVRSRVSQLERVTTGADRFAVAGRQVYLYCPNGYGRTKLSNAFLERRLEVEATTRNWRTVTELAELVGT
jgi:uncharacterized protein (DUF1697 family)